MTYDVFQLPRLGRLARETLRSGREQVRLYFQLLMRSTSAQLSEWLLPRHCIALPTPY